MSNLEIKEKKIILAGKYFPFALLFLFLISAFMPQSGFDYDMSCWAKWAKAIFKNGLTSVYDSGSDYLPFYHYFLFLFGKIAGSAERIDEWIGYVKIISLLFHFTAGYFLFRMIHSSVLSVKEALIKTAFYVLNIAVLYNAVIWGQTDDILSCLIFISFYFAYEKRISLSVLFLVLALNFKLQGIVFVPLLALMWLPVGLKSFSLTKMLRWVAPAIVVQCLLLLPFKVEHKIWDIVSVVVGSVDRYPMISMNAYNLWSLIFPHRVLSLTPDSTILLGISIKHWGFLLFFSTSALALFPLAKSVFKRLSNQEAAEISLSKLLLIAALIPLLFFFLNTQMHERYSHPALIFLVAYSIFSKKPWPAIIGSLAYLFNLEAVLQWSNVLSHSSVIFRERFVALLYLTVIVNLFLALYDISPAKSSIVQSLKQAVKEQRRVFLFAGIVFLSNLIFRTLLLTDCSIWYDEAFTLFHSQAALSDIIQVSKWDANPPFYFMMAHFWIKVFGLSAISIRMLSVLLMSLAGGVMYYYMERTFNRFSAVISSLLFISSGSIFYYAQEARGYPLLFCLIIMSFILMGEILKRPSITKGILLGLCYVLIFYTHYIEIIIAGFQGVILLIEKRKPVTKSFLIAVAVFFVSISVWIFRIQELFLSGGNHTVDAPTLEYIPRVFREIYNSSYSLVVKLFLIQLIGGVSYFFYRSKIDNQKKRNIETLLITFFGSIVLILILSFKTPMFSGRYLLFTALILYMIIGYLISELRVNVYASYAIVFILFLSGLFTMDFKIDKGMDYRHAVPLVKSMKDKRTIVILQTRDMRPLFSYYYNQDYFKSYFDQPKLLAREQVLAFDDSTDISKIEFQFINKVILVQTYAEFKDPYDCLKNYLGSVLSIVKVDTSYKGVKLFFYENKGSKIYGLADSLADSVIFSSMHQDYQKKIRENTDWLQQLAQKAAMQNIPLDTLISREAAFMISEEERLGGINYRIGSR